jgi:hypothetical protein
MKKIFYVSLIAIMLLLSMGPMEVSAQPKGDWISNIYCVNQEETEAGITLRFFNNGVEVYSFTDSISPLKSKYYFPSDLVGLSTFSGSLVIESSAGLSCSVQSSSKATGTQANPFMYGASGGFDQNSAAPVMYVSQVLKNFSSGAFGFYNSYIAIQNTSDTKVTVQIEYTDRSLKLIPAATKDYEIEGRSNILVHLHENTSLPDQFLGFAKVSAKDGVTPLVVQTAFYNDSSSYTKAQFNFYNGVSIGENKLYAPFIMRNFYDFNAGFNVVNVGTTPTSFKIVFTIGRSTSNTYTYQHPYVLQPGRIVAFFTPDIAALNPVDSLPVQERAGSAVIYAAQTDGTLNPEGKIIANINYRNDGRWAATPQFAGAAISYNAVGAEYAGKLLFVPNIQNKVGGAQFTSGINVANLENKVGSCTYKFVDDPTVSWTKSIPANGIYVILVSNITGLDVGYNSAAIIECDVDVIAIITSRADASGFWGDSHTAINALKP